MVVETGGASDSEYCFPDYECQFTYPDPSGHTFWSFDFSSLCNAMQDYAAVDAQNHTYYFNICGMSRFRCLPNGYKPLQFGVVMQTWGSPPVCNTTNPACVDPISGARMCCTADCEALGVGRPIYEPIDATNLKSGGIAVTQQGVYPSYVTIGELQHIRAHYTQTAVNSSHVLFEIMLLCLDAQKRRLSHVPL
jgi:hypothetical protein